MAGDKTHDEIEHECLRMIYDAAMGGEWRAAKKLVEPTRRARNAERIDGHGNRWARRAHPTASCAPSQT